MNSNTYSLRRLLALAIFFLILAALWNLFGSHSYISVKLGAADRFTLTQGTDSKVALQANKDGYYRLLNGTYVLTFLKGNTAISLQVIRVRPLVWHSYSAVAAPPPLYPHILLNKPAEEAVPLNGAWLYLSSPDRGLHYYDGVGDIDMTASLGIAKNASGQSSPSYDSIVGLYEANGQAVVATSLGVFVVRSASDVTKLAALNTSQPIVAGAYDAAARQFYVLTAGNRTIYRYDVSREGGQPISLLTTAKTINRLVAADRKLVLYYDAVPNTDQTLMKVYSQQKQLSPLLVNTVNKQVSNISDVLAPTYISLSPDAHYVLIKPRFASIARIYDTAGGKLTSTLPAPDMAAATWKGENVYFGRNGAIWSQNITTQAIRRVSQLGAGAVALTAVNSKLNILTAGGQLFDLSNTNTGFAPTETPTTYTVGAVGLYEYYAGGQ